MSPLPSSSASNETETMQNKTLNHPEYQGVKFLNELMGTIENERTIRLSDLHATTPAAAVMNRERAEAQERIEWKLKICLSIMALFAVVCGGIMVFYSPASKAVIGGIIVAAALCLAMMAHLSTQQEKLRNKRYLLYTAEEEKELITLITDLSYARRQEDTRLADAIIEQTRQTLMRIYKINLPELEHVPACAISQAYQLSLLAEAAQKTRLEQLHERYNLTTKKEATGQ